MQDLQTVYHYTSGKRLKAIISSGLIKTSPSFSKNLERAVVWCSVRSDWEPSAASIYLRPDKSLALRDAKEIFLKEGGLFRIKLKPEVKLFNWEQYLRISRISKKHRLMLLDFAEKCGADTSMWRVSFDDISLNMWDNVEIFQSLKGLEVWSEKGRWLNCLIKNNGDLPLILKEIKNCLSFMNKRQKERLKEKLAKLEMRYAE